jgi:hypothetical protein
MRASISIDTHSRPPTWQIPQKKAFLGALTPKAINKVPRAGSKKIGDRSN